MLVLAGAFFAVMATPSPIQKYAFTGYAALEGYDLNLGPEARINLWGGIDINIPQLELTRKGDDNGEVSETITVTNFVFNAPLWAFWQEYAFHTISLKSASVNRGGQTALSLSRLDTANSTLAIEGSANGSPLSLSLPLKIETSRTESEGEAGTESTDKIYTLADNGQLDVTFNNIRLRSQFTRTDDMEGLILSEMTLGAQSVNGRIIIDDILEMEHITLEDISGKDITAVLIELNVVRAPAERPAPLAFKVKGEINRGDNDRMDVDLDHFEIGGSQGQGRYSRDHKGQTIKLDFARADITELIRLAKLEVKKSDTARPSAMKGTITLDQGFYNGRDVISGRFSYTDDTKLQRLVAEDAVLAQSDNWRFEALNGEEEGFALATTVNNASFKDFSVVLGMEPDFVQTGRADAEIKLSAPQKIKSFTPFPKSVQGKAQFAVSKSDIDTQLVDRFVGGLLNTIFPDAGDVNRASLNCAFTPFTINDGVATLDGGLIDTQRAQLKLKGTADLHKNQLDIYIEPNPKGLALGDLSVPVYIKGPLSDPRISPSKLGIGKKIGGLVLGMSNPIFFAFTLTDFSLPDDHPCVDVVKQADQDAQGNKDNTAPASGADNAPDEAE